MNYTRLLILALITLIALSSGIVFYKNSCPKNPNALTVGMIIGYAPYAMLKADGSYEGFDIDVAQQIAHSLGKELVIKDMDLPALIIALQQNKLDMVLTGLSITPTRQKAIAMIHYAGKPVTSYPLVFWKQIPDGIHRIADTLTVKRTTIEGQPQPLHHLESPYSNVRIADLLATNRRAMISVEPGSVQEAFLMSQVSERNIHHTESMSDIVMNLKYGKVAAALLDPDIFPTLKQHSPELVALMVELPPAYQSKGVGIGINLNNNQLYDQVTNIINQLKENGTLAQLHAKWFGA